MSTAEETPATGATGNPLASPLPGEPDASYVDPDLSFKDSVGTLPEDEQAWSDARDAAREESVEAAEARDKEVLEARATEAEEATAKAESLQEVREKVAAAQEAGAQAVVNVDLP